MKKRIIILIIILAVVGGAVYYFRPKQATVAPTSAVIGFNCPVGAQFKTSTGVVITAEQKNKNDKNIEELSKQTESAEKYFNLAVAYRIADQLDKSCAALLKSLSLKNDMFLTYSALGTVYQEMGDNGQAEKAFQQAIVANPKDTNAYTKLAFLYQQAKMKTKAEIIAFYEQAIIKNDGNVNLARDYAQFLETNEEYDKAIDMWRAILQREGGKDQGVKDKIKQLTALQNK